MHFNNVKTCEKCEKSLNKCGNMLKNRKLHVLILFLFWTNNSLRSLWTYWHESLNMNICLCGILMFKFNILKFKTEHEKRTYIWKKRNNGAKKQELFNCLLLPFFTCFPCYSHFFTCLKRMFFTFFSKRISKPLFFRMFFHIFHNHVKKCEKKKRHFEHALGNNEKCVLKMHLEKREKMRKKTFEHPVGKVELWFFGVEFCCSYFAACPTSAGWKSQGSSSNQSEVDCVDRRPVYIIYHIYSKAMTARSKNIKSNAEGKENKASNCLNKYIFSHVKNNACLKHSFFTCVSHF